MKKEYTANELHLMAVLPDGEKNKVATAVLIKLHYGPRQPKYARQAITWAIRSINKKMQKNRENMRIYSTPRNGPYEAAHWMIKQAGQA